MTTTDSLRLAAALARAVDLLRRSPEPGETQKVALRSLVALAAERSATFRFYGDTLTVDGADIPTTDPRLATFTQRLAAQQVAEITIARGAGPDELLALSLGLSAEPGHGRLKERLRDAGSTRVMVVLHQALANPLQTRSVSAAFEKVKMDQAVLSDWNAFLDHGAKTERERLSFWERPPLEAGGPAGSGDHASAASTAEEQPSGGAPNAPEPAAPAAEPPSPPPRLPQPLTLQGSSPLGTALLNLVSDPYGEETLARLTQLSRYVQDAFSQDRVAEAIDAAATLVDLEAKAPDPRLTNTYAVILARILTRTVLEQSAPYVHEPRRRDRATAVLRRGGDVAVELLLSLISEAHTLGERIQYYAVLRDIPRGTDRLLTLMSKRSEWQRARNVAELAGEARIEAAVPYLARFLEDDDDRLYRTALVALAKIGTATTAEPLRSVLKSGPPEVRSLVLSNISGAQARPLAATLATIAEEEHNPEILRECLRALGRIGTPDALEALQRVAGRSALFSRRTRTARAVAEDVLRSLDKD